MPENKDFFGAANTFGRGLLAEAKKAAELTPEQKASIEKLQRMLKTF